MRVVGPKSRYANQFAETFMAQLKLNQTSRGNTEMKNEKKKNDGTSFLSRLQRDITIR